MDFISFCSIGLDYDAAYRYASKNPDIETLDPKEAARSFYALKTMGIQKEEVMKCPSILNQFDSTLINRFQILNEVGFKSIKFMHLNRYLQISRTTITTLKLYNVLYDQNIIERLIKSFELECEMQNLNENQTILLLRQTIMTEYLKRTLNFTEKQVATFWHSYYRIKHKSAASILEMVQILKNELEFDNDRIQHNAYVLYGDPQNLREILRRFKKIGGIKTKELLLKRPKLLMQAADTIENTLNTLRDYNISENSLAIFPTVLTLSTETIKERLKNLKSIKEFDSLLDNPRILKLVHYQIKAKARLQYLQQLKFKCASLNLLSGSDEVFEKYTQEGADKTKGNDITGFLSFHFRHTEQDVREYVSRHPNWLCVPLGVMKENLNFLLAENFKKQDIYKHVYILSYPNSRIKEKLAQVRNDSTFTHVSKVKQLSLVLYFLEYEYHFTGDGVWSDLDVLSTSQSDPSGNPINTQMSTSLDDEALPENERISLPNTHKDIQVS